MAKQPSKKASQVDFERTREESIRVLVSAEALLGDPINDKDVEMVRGLLMNKIIMVASRDVLREIVRTLIVVTREGARAK